MKKSLLAMTALAAMLFAGCTSSDELTTLESIKQAENAPAPISFGTYMGRTGTRAGYTGNMNDAQLQESQANGGGFGVFAYYTGLQTYNEANYNWVSTALTPTVKPNFMYNQGVFYNSTSTKWEYTPVKYWPNDFASNADVDNQDAKGSPTYGGNVSFFAYAPYVSTGSGTTGITGITANNVSGDPILDYVLSTSNTQENCVDLLWGTLDATTTTQKATETGSTNTNTGVSGDNNNSNDGSDNRTYAQAILKNYTTCADLNKQKIDGKVGFLFKHTLAGLGGGSNVSSGIGFQVILDIDEKVNSLNAREKFNNTGTNDAWRTIVTIKDINITNDLDGNGSIDNSDVGQALSGKFNLATGQWTNLTETGIVSQTIGVTGVGTPNAVLNSKIAEDKSSSETWFANLTSSNVVDYFKDDNALDATKDHPGVTETAINVYNSSTQSPLMFIPGSNAPKFKITVEYIVRTYDASLDGKCTMVPQKISKIVTFPAKFELNKHYNLIMHLGLTDVKFVATVAGWDELEIGDSNGDSSDDNMIFLPINVQ